MSYLESLKSIAGDAKRRMEYDEQNGADRQLTFDEAWRAELYDREILSTEPITDCENKNCDTQIVGTITHITTFSLEITVDRAQYFAFKNHMQAMAKLMRITVGRHRGKCYRSDTTYGLRPKPQYQYQIMVALNENADLEDFKRFVGKKVVIRYTLKPYDRRKKMCPHIHVMMTGMRVQN